ACVCWSITSDTQTAYGSLEPRHGYARRRGTYQTRRASLPRRRRLGLLDGMTTVRDIMSKDLVAVEPTATVAEAATLMGGHHVGSALVIEDGRATGIFTERDVLRALASDFDAAHHPVADLVADRPTTVDIDTAVRPARTLIS